MSHYAKKAEIDRLKDDELRYYTEKTNLLTNIGRGETSASIRLENIGSGGKEAPKVMKFGHGTLLQTSKEASKRKQYKQVIVDHVHSSKQYKRLHAIVTRTFEEYTDVKGPFQSTKDLDADYFQHSVKALREESRLFSRHLKLAIEEEDVELYASLIGQVQPISRGSTSGSDPVEVVAEDDGIRQFEILNRTLLSTNDQVRKDLKESIESALQKVNASGNPIAVLNTTTKHDLDKYTDLELHVDWAETAQPMMRHLVTRCRIGADMTKVCGILDKYLAKSPEDIHDPNQKYIQMINDISTAWAEQSTGETYAKSGDDTQLWMLQWWARHMVSNEDETAHVNTNSTQHQPRDDGMTVHVPYKIPGHMAERFRQYSWCNNSYHVRNYRQDGTPVFRSGFNHERDIDDGQFNVGASTRVIRKTLNLREHMDGTRLSEPPNPLPDCAPTQKRRPEVYNNMVYKNDRGCQWGGSGGPSGQAWGQSGNGEWGNRQPSRNDGETHRTEQDRRDRLRQQERDARNDEVGPRNGRDSRRRSRSHDRHRSRDGSNGRDSSNTVSFSDQHGKGSGGKGTNKRLREHKLHTNMCVSFGCQRLASKKELCTWQFDLTDYSKEVKTLLHTCSACVQAGSEACGPPTKIMKVIWEDGADLAVRDVHVMNPKYEAGDQDIHHWP